MISKHWELLSSLVPSPVCMWSWGCAANNHPLWCSSNCLISVLHSLVVAQLCQYCAIEAIKQSIAHVSHSNKAHNYGNTFMCCYSYHTWLFDGALSSVLATRFALCSLTWHSRLLVLAHSIISLKLLMFHTVLAVKFWVSKCIVSKNQNHFVHNKYHRRGNLHGCLIFVGWVNHQRNESLKIKPLA